MDKLIFFLKNIFLKSELHDNFLKSKINDFIESYNNDSYAKDAFILDKLDYPLMSCVKSSNFVFDRNIVNLNIPVDSQILVFFNGYYVSSFFLNNDIKIFEFNFKSRFLNEKLRTKSDLFLFNDFNDLNIFSVFDFLLNENTFIVYIPKQIVSKPLYFLNFFDNPVTKSMSNTRVFIYLDDFSSIDIFEYSFFEFDNLFVNSNKFVKLCKNSNLSYYLLNNFSGLSFYTQSMFVNQLAYSNFYSNYLSVNKSFCKKYFNLYLSDKNAKVYFCLSEILKNKAYSYIDFNLNCIDSNVDGNVFFRSIVVDSSSCFFNGCLNVLSNLDKIIASLKCDALLLSSESSCTLVPELSIMSSDVKCFHGATIGFLDNNIIYYMRTRGLSYSECLDLIVNSFLFVFFNKNSNFDCLVGNVIGEICN